MLFFVAGLVLMSLLASTVSLYRISEVTRFLDSVNRISVPVGRVLTQMQSDAEVFRREMDRGLGRTHWKDAHWRPRPIPRWIEDVLINEVDRVQELMKKDSEGSTVESRKHWQDWASNLSVGFTTLRSDASKLYSSLDQHDDASAESLYPRWNAELEEWLRQLQWGVGEYDRTLRQTFALAESRAAELRTGLEVILVVVVGLSLLLLWLGERALRPLAELTRLAREITRRGLRREDKSLLPEISLARTDEVSQLAREFHHMATALLEREKIVDSQKNRLQEKNQLLHEMGELNENVLKSIETPLIVTDLEGRITQCNPEALKWLEASRQSGSALGSELLSWPRVVKFFALVPAAGRWFDTLRRGHIGQVDHGFTSLMPLTPNAVHNVPRLGTCQIDGRIYGGRLMPLKNETGESNGAILVIDDLTEEMELQARLKGAEHLAAIGRMSAQVAHEIRNPLHSLGLEAEVAAEAAQETGNIVLKQSVQSILQAVDRLEKITENYLKLSRLSAGKRAPFDVGESLENVLATYASACEAGQVRVDWQREPKANLTSVGDSDLFEQVLGNLFRNSLQALQEPQLSERAPEIKWTMGNTVAGEIWIRIEDSGAGVPAEVREKLFTPFVTTRAQGTGLGLSFVKKVIEDHGGSITLIDQKVKSGACFEVVLPSWKGDVHPTEELAAFPLAEMNQETHVDLNH
jgi:nitrogen fixation/metabolism regulation signal transduction histidine kinase